MNIIKASGLVFTIAAIANFAAWPFALTPAERAYWTPFALSMLFASFVCSMAMWALAWERARKHSTSERSTVEIQRIHAQQKDAERRFDIHFAQLAAGVADKFPTQPQRAEAPATDLFATGERGRQVAVNTARVYELAAAIVEVRETEPGANSQAIRARLHERGETVSNDEFSAAYQFVTRAGRLSLPQKRTI